MANTWACGANIRFSVIFKDAFTLAYIDPTTVTFKIRTPENGAITIWVFGVDPEVIKDSVGHYHADYTADFPGYWLYRWEGAGNYIGGFEKRFCIMETGF